MNNRLLIVDDEAGVCLLLREWLTSSGFVCQTAANGAEALKILAEHEIDAIVSDLSMPGLSGLDLLVKVRQAYPHTAFLMATGVDDIGLVIQAMKQGADDYILKPFQLDAVVASVGRALEMRRLEREVENYRTHLEEMVEERTGQLRDAIEHIGQIYDETLEALGAALDLKDGDTAGHARRVTRYCLEIAKAMGCSAEQMGQLKRGAYLHDIGKMAIPDAILLKPDKLTPEEMSVMWAHPYIGYEFVGRISFLAEAAEIVLTHHERYDGSGYPQGLMGDQIPLGARDFCRCGYARRYDLEPALSGRGFPCRGARGNPATSGAAVRAQGGGGIFLDPRAYLGRNRPGSGRVPPFSAGDEDRKVAAARNSE